MKIKLHWKLTAAFCLGVLLALSAGVFFLTRRFKQDLEIQLENNLRRDLLLARDYGALQLRESESSFATQSWVEKISADTGLRVTVVGADGKVIGDSEMSAEQRQHADNHLTRPEIQQALRTGFGMSRRYSISIKQRLLYMAAPVHSPQTGFIRLAMPLSAVESLERNVEHTVRFGALLVFALSFVLMGALSVKISRPLVDMAAVARSMAQGDFSKKPILKSKDELGDLSEALRDMAEKIRNQIDTIKAESAKLDAVMSSLFEGLMAVDEKGQIILTNPSLRKLFLIDRESSGKKVIEVVRYAAVQDFVDQILSDGRARVGQDIVLHDAGERIFKMNGAPILSGGQLKGAVVVFHDVTELRRLERVRQDFVANVSHELRTPISNIKGYTETLLQGAMKEPDTLNEFLEIIEQNSERLSALTNDLLDLAKLESVNRTTELVPLKLGSLVERALTILDKPIKEKSLTVLCDVPESLAEVRCDEGWLLQAFLNLLDNAIKYTPEKGSIRVQSKESDESIQIDFCDTGIGIPEKDLPRIFERFYRVDKSRSREQGGTGLGLSIVKHVMQAHGGDCRVHSLPGQGSTFTLVFPRT